MHWPIRPSSLHEGPATQNASSVEAIPKSDPHPHCAPVAFGTQPGGTSGETPATNSRWIRGLRARSRPVSVSQFGSSAACSRTPFIPLQRRMRRGPTTRKEPRRT